MLMRPVARNEPPTLVLPKTRPAEAWISKLANLPLQLKVAAVGLKVAPAITAPKICTLAPEIKAVLLSAMVEIWLSAPITMLPLACTFKSVFASITAPPALP